MIKRTDEWSSEWINDQVNEWMIKWMDELMAYYQSVDRTGDSSPPSECLLNLFSRFLLIMSLTVDEMIKWTSANNYSFITQS